MHQEAMMLITLLILIALGSVLIWTLSQDGVISTTENTLTDDFEDIWYG